MKVPLTLLVLVCVVFKIVGVLLFLQGYFPLSSSLEGFATFDTQPSSPVPMSSDTKPEPLFGRLVIVVIDALRADFVLPIDSNRPRMNYVESLIRNKETLSFMATANPPTVTLPRLKALTSGIIPGFAHVVLNFESQAMQEDNIISQLHRLGRRIVFYGDDTWINMFPGHFVRSDGTTSFFVTDYTEVDNNVTRHLDSELGDAPSTAGEGPEQSSTGGQSATSAPGDWDVLILHYLGLDHIGHAADPLSPLIPTKLQEMDGIVKRIYEAVKEQDKSLSLPTLLMLCGDHGMSDHGGHGGSSPSEINTPIVFLSSAFQHQGGLEFDGETEIQQIDVVPTLSALLGIPIPQNSLGVVIPAVLRTLLRSHVGRQLGVLHANAHQLSDVFKHNVPNYESDDLYNVSFHRAVRMHLNWLEHFSRKPTSEAQGTRVQHQYIKVMTSMRDRVAASLTKYDLHSIGVAIAVLWMVLVSLVHGYARRKHGNFELPVELHGFFLFMLLAGILSTAHMVECADHGEAAAQYLCSDTDVVRVLSTLLLYGTALFCTAVMVKSSKFTSGLALPVPRTLFSGFLPMGTTVHSLTLLSSSLVEEEHQTWYFLTLTSVLLLMLHSIYAYRLQCKAADRHTEMIKCRERNLHHLRNTSSISSLHCSLYQPSVTQQPQPEAANPEPLLQSSSGLPPILPVPAPTPPPVPKDTSGLGLPCQDATVTDVLSADQTRVAAPTLAPLVPLAIVLFLCRVCRTWNQTGDKWAHLPDVGDWLIKPENKPALSFLSVLSFLIFVTSRIKENSLCSTVLLSVGCTLVYHFRAVRGEMELPFVSNPELSSTVKSKGVLEARMVFGVIVLILVNMVGKYLTLRHATQNVKIFQGKSSMPTQSVNQRNSGKAAEDIDQKNFGMPTQNHDQRVSGLAVILHEMQNAWLLLMFLLLRPHNITLVTMISLQELLLRSYLGRRSHLFSTSVVTLMYLWMGQAAFFYQGNSNSLNTLDLSSCYVGLSDFHPVPVATLLLFSTYAGTIFWIISMLLFVVQCKVQDDVSKNLVDSAAPNPVTVDLRSELRKAWGKNLLEVSMVLTLTRALPLAIYTVLVTVQRYHLFVWTVFSPKLLYEGMLTLVISLVVVTLLGVRIVTGRR